MKKTFLLVVLAIGFLSCNSYKKNYIYIQNEGHKDNWMDSYRYEAFCACVKEAIGNDSLRIILKNKDLFYPNLDIPFRYIDSARFTGKKLIASIPKPNVKIDKGDEEYFENKKYYSISCLKFYESKDLARKAKKVYNDYIKELKDEL